MRQIHTRVLLTTSLLLCVILLPCPVFSSPVRPNSTTLGRPLTTTRTTLNAPTPTDLPEPPPDTTSGISGMSIFWIIMALSLACMTHPIGSACGFEATGTYRHGIRIGPLMSLFDTLHLLYEIHHRYRSVGDGDSAISRVYNAIRKVVEMRLHLRWTREQNNDNNPHGVQQTATLLYRFEECLYNTPIRHLVSAVLILQYTKICGFYGIPMSFSLATGYFVSWIIMEMILLVGEGRTAMEPSQAALPHSDSSSPPTIPKSIGRGVFFLQSIVILVLISMLLLKAQSEFKFVPKHGETVPSFDLRYTVFLIISLSLMSWVDSMPLFVGISLMSELYDSGHRNSRKVSDFIGLSMAIAYVSFITPVFYTSWIVGAGHFLFVSSITLSYASRLFWLGEEGAERRKGCWIMARLEPLFTFGSSALTYAGGLLFFYVFVFNPEGTSKASWTEYLP